MSYAGSKTGKVILGVRREVGAQIRPPRPVAFERSSIVNDA